MAGFPLPFGPEAATRCGTDVTRSGRVLSHTHAGAHGRGITDGGTRAGARVRLARGRGQLPAVPPKEGRDRSETEQSLGAQVGAGALVGACRHKALQAAGQCCCAHQLLRCGPNRPCMQAVGQRAVPCMPLLGCAQPGMPAPRLAWTLCKLGATGMVEQTDPRT